MMTLVKFSKYPWCSCILRLQQTSAISTSTTVNMKKLPKSEKYAMIRRGQKTEWQKFLRKCDGFPTSAQAQWFQMAYALSFIPPVYLHWFFEIFIRTEKKFQLELKKKINYK